MRPFYLTKNRCGYYIVSFTNKETGSRTIYKSTGTKDYNNALSIAMKWYSKGVPSKGSRDNGSQSDFDFENLIQRLTVSDAKTLYDMISVKFGFIAVSTPVLNDSPAPVNTESKKKIVVVH